MTKVLRLYPIVPRVQQDFSKAKVHVLPMQCLTLKEIIKRFVRREQLPIEHDGIYEENLGDLEKIQREDITVRMDRIETLKDGLDKRSKRIAREEAAKKAEEDAKKAEVPKV